MSLILASLVVKLIRADLLIMLSTVDGLRDRAPNGRSLRVHYIESITRNTFKLVSDGESTLSKGGMGSKLRAALTASKTGCSVVIADGKMKNVLPRVMRGDDVGTLVLASAL